MELHLTEKNGDAAPDESRAAPPVLLDRARQDGGLDEDDPGPEVDRTQYTAAHESEHVVDRAVHPLGGNLQIDEAIQVVHRPRCPRSDR